MPVDEKYKITKITEDSISRMPKAMGRRLRPALRPELETEFFACIQDLGYKPHMASPVFRQMLFELFVGGWGAKTRQLKRRKAEREKSE